MIAIDGGEEEPITANAENKPTQTATVETIDKAVTHAECEESGRFERFSIESTLMNGELAFSIYFPPCFYDQGGQVYAVIYLLHGQRQNDSLWQSLGAGEAADELIASGAVQPFLMVMPYEEFYFRASDKTTAFSQAFLEEVLLWVEDNLPACADKACRAIGGISRGASWAVRLGLQEWQLFGAIGAHSLPAFNGDLELLDEWLAEIPRDEIPRIYLDIGSSDPEVKNAVRFEQALNERGIAHEWHLNPGQHNDEYWHTWIGEYLRWYTMAWHNENPQ